MTWAAGSLRIEPLGVSHDRQAFDCGVASLNRYLREQSSQDMRRAMVRVFVAVPVDQDARILGFFTLSAATITTVDLPPELARRLPRYPVPAALIGRLAVDQSVAGQGVGSLLLAAAVGKARLAAETVAMMAMVVDPIDEAARGFYAAFGFCSLLGLEQRMFLMLPCSGRPSS
ncbi:GNAT family N-acetyltransferase [uncultured Thiodictyon sp.]|uniref:GNAT family N-acetyltransferase n=1 Tax=uncultured Thiodictyon sp. TaxID=1846217 RepID=UPI0025EDAB9F|nr:GNAT family N-acetyltransferase [uncultured Thiodictyon sp.]